MKIGKLCRFFRAMMENNEVSVKLKDLQAILFPVQPIPANTIVSQCLQARFEIERKDLESDLSLTSGFAGFDETARKTFQNLLVDSGLIGFDAVSQGARWPIECQVLPERVRHIEYSPVDPEEFYIPSGKEPQPKPVTEEIGTVLYHYFPLNTTNYFSRSCVGGTTIFNTDTLVDSLGANIIRDDLGDYSENDLCFESRFESGNLGKVIKITDTYYQLHLRADLYTQRHMQWYYFRISNTRRGTMYRLSIVNLCKEDSLYNEGLRPLLYSTKDADVRSIGWRRCGENISYYKNDSSSDEERERHTLTFNIYFPHNRDTVYLAHCYPYTYTDLQEYLAKIAIDPAKTRFTKLRLLCRTLAGNGVYYLTITAPSLNEESRRKKGVVITARVHPGETPSSWIMKGIIDFLTGDSNEAKELRERFIFKLIPMLNPDGVIVGNNRCSLSGKDLNRQYRTVMRESYPSVWHTKLMIRRLMDECGIAMYCDLHAHSRKHNIFIYGCESRRNSFGKLTEQVFPLMLHKNAADKFSFENCKFHIEKGKEGTGRVVVWLMGIQNSYTMEASLGGSKLGSRDGTHFSTEDYEQIGKSFCETLLDFSDNDPIKEKLRNKIIARLVKEGSSADEPTNIDLTDYSSDEGDTSESSSEEEKKRTAKRNCSSDVEDPFMMVPPPTPSLLKPDAIQMLNRLKKSKFKLTKDCVTRRKEFEQRKAMDLPTTDPGSDLLDMSDSENELFFCSATEINTKSKQSDDEQLRTQEKENQNRKSELQLPCIVRQRSLSLGDELLPEELARKHKICLKHRRIPIPFRNLSPISPRNDTMEIRLMSLKQRHWSNAEAQNSLANANSFPFHPRFPGNLGVPRDPVSYPTEKDDMLTSCSQKLEQLKYHKTDVKKPKKKMRRKSSKLLEIPPVIMSQEEEMSKKRRPRPKRLRSAKQSADTEPEPETSDPIKMLESLKLPKLQQSKSKIESHRKFNKVLLASSACKTKFRQSLKMIEDSSSSESTPIMSRKKSSQKKIGSLNKKSIRNASANKK